MSLDHVICSRIFGLDFQYASTMIYCIWSLSTQKEYQEENLYVGESLMDVAFGNTDMCSWCPPMDMPMENPFVYK